MRVQRTHRGVDTRGLALSGDNQRLAAVRQKVLRNGVDPARIHTRHIRSRLAGGPGRTEARRERRDKRSDLPALETEPVIGHRSRQRVDAFDGVEPVHRATRGSCTPSVSEAARVTDRLRIGEQRIGVEAEDHRGSIESEHEIDVASRRLAQACKPVLVADGVVGRPLHLGEAGSELGDQARQGGRGEGLGEDRKAGAAICGVRLGQLSPGRHEIGPRFPLTLQRDRLRAVRIVEAEHRRLHARARGPER